MRELPANPMLYQVNTRVLMRAMGETLGRPATLDDLPDAALAHLRDLGVDWVWMLGVWRTDAAGRAISRTNPAWQAQFHEALADLSEEDIAGSPFAIAGYDTDPAFGGDAALARLRDRLHAHDLRLMLDFVPNHMAPDHPWVGEHPALFVRGTQADLDREPLNWIRIGDTVFAHGRDPYFPGWCDTVQLDYANPDTHAAMSDQLLRIADRCDGVRCDVAMLLLPDVFERTWSAELAGRSVQPFWPDAIARARAAHPAFRLMAEVYWGLDGRLLADGFDWAYDKALYDALRDGESGQVRDILSRNPSEQARMARFLENHDEQRAAATFPWPKHQAAALLCFAVPGLRFLHQGQLEGRRVHIPIHLDRGPDEAVDEPVLDFYTLLLSVLDQPAFRDGTFQPVQPGPAWDGNPSHARFVSALWRGDDGATFLLVVNFGPDRGQCRLHAGLGDGALVLDDCMGSDSYSRDGAEIGRDGLFIDLPGWGYNLFAVR